LDPRILLAVELSGRPHLICDAVRAGASDLGGFGLGGGGRVNVDIEDQVDEACEQASGGGVTLKERMPFLDLYLQTRASREFLRDPVKNLDRVGRIIMAPGSKAIA
jgi:hypothetical protein